MALFIQKLVEPPSLWMSAHTHSLSVIHCVQTLQVLDSKNLPWKSKDHLINRSFLHEFCSGSVMKRRACTWKHAGKSHASPLITGSPDLKTWMSKKSKLLHSSCFWFIRWYLYCLFACFVEEKVLPDWLIFKTCKIWLFVFLDLLLLNMLRRKDVLYLFFVGGGVCKFVILFNLYFSSWAGEWNL